MTFPHDFCRTFAELSWPREADSSFRCGSSPVLSGVFSAAGGAG
jgi:hypothetical protein